jgi:hypothetical protein
VEGQKMADKKQTVKYGDISQRALRVRQPAVII